MTCRYCGAGNHEDDHRCVRCGRRMSGQPVAEWAANRGATAPAMAPVLAVSDPITPVEEAPAVRARLSYQPALFGPQVIPTAVSERRRQPRAERPLKQEERPDLQQSLFVVEPPPPKTLKTLVEPSIYCNAPVAMPGQRMIAAALDVALILIAAALLMAVFAVAGGEIVLNNETRWWFAAIPVIVGLFYRALWWIACGDSPGLRFVGLKLLNFDGQPPSRQERLCRVASGCLSLFAAGLGLFWALTDEEKLTWHDHISRTFPTPVQLGRGQF